MRVISRVLLLLAVAAYGLLSADTLQDGIQAFHEGRFSAALPLLQKAVNGGQNKEAVVLLALAQAATNDCAAALPVLRSIEQDAGEELTRLAGLSAAKCESRTGDFPGALLTLESVRRRFPKDADALYLTAEIEMTAFNEATFAMFEQTPASYRTHQLSGEILEIQERFSDAASEYKRAIELNPAA